MTHASRVKRFLEWKQTFIDEIDHNILNIFRLTLAPPPSLFSNIRAPTRELIGSLTVTLQTVKPIIVLKTATLSGEKFFFFTFIVTSHVSEILELLEVLE